MFMIVQPLHESVMWILHMPHSLVGANLLYKHCSSLGLVLAWPHDMSRVQVLVSLIRLSFYHLHLTLYLINKKIFFYINVS